MFQQFMAVGNLGNDPEMRFTPGGTPVTTFSLAINKTWVNADGQKQEKTLWVRVACWRKTAENAAQYLHKGSRILITGEVETPSAWLDKSSGQLRASVEVTAHEIKFLSAKGESGQADAPSPQPAEAAQETSNGRGFDEDVPF